MTTIHIRVVWTKWCEEEVVLRYYSKTINAFVSFKVLSCDYIKRLLNDVERSWPQSHTIVCCVAWQKKEYSQKDHFHVICSDGMAGTPAIFPSCAAITICLWQWKAHRSEEEPILFELPYKKVDSSSNKRLSDSSWRITAYYMQSRDGRYVLPSSVDYASAPIVTDQSHCHTEKKSHFFLRLAFWLCICTGANGMSPARRLAFNRIFLGVEVEKTNKKYPRRRKKVM